MKERREERLSLSYVGEAGEVEALLLLFSREKIENPSLSVCGASEPSHVFLIHLSDKSATTINCTLEFLESLLEKIVKLYILFPHDL